MCEKVTMKSISVYNNLPPKKQNTGPLKLWISVFTELLEYTQLYGYISFGLLWAWEVGIVTSILQKNWDDR